MVILKFGGTSVADAGPIGQAAAIVARTPGPKVVVVSALAGVTDRLLQAARLAADGRLEAARGVLARLVDRHRRLADALAGPGAPDLQKWIGRCTEEVDALAGAAAVLRDLPPRFLDAIAAAGELLSSRLVAAAFERAGVLASWVDARHVIVTDAEHTAATPLLDPTAARLDAALRPLFAAGRVPVLGGFIGATAEGVTTTLGRGGSDYSAAIVGLGVGAREIQIWTDVDGMLTADPRVYPSPRRIRVISFAEAAELAYFGAKVLHPSTIQPAVQAGIPVRVLNSRRPEGEGTLIVADPPPSRNVVKAIACKRGITLVNVTSTRMLMAYGFLHRIFEVFDRHRTAVDMLATSEVSVSLTLDDDTRLDSIVAELGQFAEVAVERDRAIVSVVGERIRSTPGVAARVFAALGDVNVQMISQGASEINIGFVIDGADLERAVARLHTALFAELDPGVFE
jgi:aspartate kinase